MLGVVLLLASVFDLADKLSGFIQSGASAKEIIFDYYVNFILLYGNMFSAMIIFLSVIWFTSKMAQDTEIIPIWNSGRAFSRFVQPYMIGATILMLLSLFLNHFLVPKANKTRLEFEEKYYWNTMSVNNYHAEYPNNQNVYFTSYRSETGTINDFTIEQTDDKKKLTSILKAQTATCVPGTNNWTLNNYWERKIHKDGTESIVEGQTIDTIFQFSIDEIATRDNIAESMNYSELKEFIERERQKGSPLVPTYETVFYERTSLPFSAYILTIIGISVASRKKRGGIGINIAIGLAFAFIYIFAMRVTAVAALKMGFPSIVSAWVPNFLFAIVAYFLYRNAQR